MTKKVLLKWLEEQKNKALVEVNAKEAESKAALAEWKYAESKLDELVAEIEPKLNEVYDRVADWHKQYEHILGVESMRYGSVRYALQDFVAGSRPMIERLKEREFRFTEKDRTLQATYEQMRTSVSRTYSNVMLNVNRLANAKLGIEYLEELGFDLTDLKTSDEKPVETALAVPIDTRFLLIKPKED